MKHSITRVLALLLVLVMAVGLLPTVALAGPDEETVYDVYVFVGYPVAGAQPDMQGAVRYDGDPYTVEEVHFFETNSEGVPIGSFLNENDTFVANRNYLCQIFLRPMAGYVFHSELYAEVNNRDNMQVELLGDGTACVSASFVCAPGTVTVTFDANGGPDPAPAPLQVPIGACIWDAIRNFDAVRLPDQPYERFYDWSKDPFATSEGYFDFFTTMNEDLTLYAMWQPTEKSVDFYVSLPEDCLMNDCPGPIIDFPADAHYGGSGDNFYIGLVDGHLHPDLVYTGPLQKGQTYYSRLTVNTNLAASLPQINLHGADFISATRVEGWDSIDVLFSVTVPAGDTLTKADLFINTPRAGQNAFEAHPEVTCLTPGVHAGVQGWFDSPELGTELYEGNLEGGKTYYALVYVGDDAGNYVVSADTLQLNVEGKNAQVVRKVDLSDTMPNYVGAVVAVTIPSAYSFTADVYYGGGKIRSDREPYKWVTTMDFSGCETGPITMEAKAAPGYMFKGWVDCETYEYLSKKPVFTFNLDRNRHIRASFVEKLPFVDVGAWDYFYEPVQWAIHHDPVITGGVDATHFGPKQNCTREQIVTFLWKANGAPEPETTENPFSDVKSNQYYYKAVLWAVENHITGGVGDGTKFGVGQTCTRGQAMTFLWASRGAPEPEPVPESPFSDVKPNAWYYKAVLWAVQYTPPVTGGIGDGKFGPEKTCTRAEIITFLYKVYGPKG